MKTIEERTRQFKGWLIKQRKEGYVPLIGTVDEFRRHLTEHGDAVRAEERVIYTRKAAHCISMGSSEARVATAVVFVKMLADGDERWRKAKGGGDVGK